MMYYQTYWHYWFLQLTDGYIPKLGIIILPLFYIAAIYHLMHSKQLRIRWTSVILINIIVVIYLIVSVLSILMNENNYSSVRIWSFYTAYPVILYFSAIMILKNITHATVTMRVIFWLGVCFSLYAMYYFIMYDLASVMPISTAMGDIRADFGGGFTGPGNVWVNRLAIPGISSPTYGSLLVLAVLIGTYFWKIAHGGLKVVYGGLTTFLGACILLTYSRGAVISLGAGVVYLLYKRFLTRQEMIRIVSLMIFIGLLFFDVLATETIRYAVRFQWIRLGDLIAEPRQQAVVSSLELWARCPIVGCGFTEMHETQAVVDHNYYTRIMATRGLAGFTPFMIFLVTLFLSVSSKKYRLGRSETSMKHILSAGMVATMINLSAFAPAEFYHVWIWFALMVVFVRAIQYDERRLKHAHM